MNWWSLINLHYTVTIVSFIAILDLVMHIHQLMKLGVCSVPTCLLIGEEEYENVIRVYRFWQEHWLLIYGVCSLIMNVTNTVYTQIHCMGYITMRQIYLLQSKFVHCIIGDDRIITQYPKCKCVEKTIQSSMSEKHQ